jgi:hypothetical protein
MTDTNDMIGETSLPAQDEEGSPVANQVFKDRARGESSQFWF